MCLFFATLVEVDGNRNVVVCNRLLTCQLPCLFLRIKWACLSQQVNLWKLKWVCNTFVGSFHAPSFFFFFFFCEFSLKPSSSCARVLSSSFTVSFSSSASAIHVSLYSSYFLSFLFSCSLVITLIWSSVHEFRSSGVFNCLQIWHILLNQMSYLSRLLWWFLFLSLVCSLFISLMVVLHCGGGFLTRY